MRIELHDEAATCQLGQRLARRIEAPAVVWLRGDLGAGKTTLVRAWVQALSPGQRVKSPTYGLIESYELPRISLHHLDLYRLRYPAELTELGLADLLDEHSIAVIEWPDRGEDQTPKADLVIDLARVGDGRIASLSGRLLERLRPPDGNDLAVLA